MSLGDEIERMQRDIRREVEEESEKVVRDVVRHAIASRRERIATAVLTGLAARGLYLEVGSAVQAADALIAELDK